MDELSDQDVTEFAQLSGKLCGDESVWKKLIRFIDGNRDVLLDEQS